MEPAKPNGLKAVGYSKFIVLKIYCSQNLLFVVIPEQATIYKEGGSRDIASFL